MLAKRERITRASEFADVFREGHVYRNSLLVLHVWPRPGADGPSARQAGFIVSKKVGHAVQRNRTKRRICEAYRLCSPRLQSAAAMVWIARAGSANANFWQIKAAVEDLLTEAHLYFPQNPDRSQPALVTSA